MCICRVLSVSQCFCLCFLELSDTIPIDATLHSRPFRTLFSPDFLLSSFLHLATLHASGQVKPFVASPIFPRGTHHSLIWFDSRPLHYIKNSCLLPFIPILPAFESKAGTAYSHLSLPLKKITILFPQLENMLKYLAPIFTAV